MQCFSLGMSETLGFVRDTCQMMKVNIFKS